MANQKVDHSDITTGGNGPFPQKRTPFFPRPSYRQTIANSLAIAKLSPGPRESLYTERQLLLLECGCHFAFDFGCGCVWRLVCLEDGWVRFQFLSNPTSLVAIFYHYIVDGTKISCIDCVSYI
jgi:hypothetical protein